MSELNLTKNYDHKPLRIWEIREMDSKQQFCLPHLMVNRSGESHIKTDRNFPSLQEWPQITMSVTYIDSQGKRETLSKKKKKCQEETKTRLVRWVVQSQIILESAYC